MIKSKFILILAISLFVIKICFADSITSAGITTATLKAIPNCMHYRIRGVCYWLDEKGVNTTLYIEQYLPDVVVSVFNKPGDNAWAEMNSTIDQASKIAEQEIVSSMSDFNVGSGQHSLSNQHEQNTFFKEAEVIGNPALAVLPDEGFLPSTAMPLFPYYQSMLDSALWRGFPIGNQFPPEEIYALLADIDHHIGSFPINWGGIYPHEGKVATSNDAKAAAVIAQRAGDLVTSSDMAHLSGHIFKQLTNQCAQECNASPIQENSEKTKYQMIFPIESNQCDFFGKTINFGEDAEKKTEGNYIWIVWRFYSGCQDGKGKFIGKTIIN